MTSTASATHRIRLHAFCQSEACAFWAGGLMGIAVFLLVFGFGILDVTNVNWLIGKGDLSQHYFGWCFFRNSDWLFPIGCADTLSWPLSSSVIYTDSIPLFALLFKALRGLLPATFQYFGWFGLLVYFFQGAVGALLVKRLTGPTLYALLASLLFILSTTMTQRIFTHTSLSAHFVILLCLLMLLTDRHPERLWRNVVIWSLLVMLAAGLHFYFVPMVMLFLLFYAIKNQLRSHRWGQFVALFFIPTAVAALTTWLLGGFTSEVAPMRSVSSNKLGEASANLNTFYNSFGWLDTPLYHRPAAPCAADFQYEGFGYLGMGVLIGLCLLIIAVAVNLVWPLPCFRKTGMRAIKRPNMWMSASIAAIFFVVALSPEVSFNGQVLFSYPVLKPVETVWSIFRASGRFIWPVVYILMLGLVVGWYRLWRRGWAAYLCLALLIAVQAVDVWPWMQRSGKAKSATSYAPDAACPQIEKMMEGKRHVCFSRYYELDEYPDILSLAAKHGLSLNAFYFARQFGGYNEYVAEQAAAALRHPSPDCLYVLADSTQAAREDFCRKLHTVHLGTYTLGTAAALPPSAAGTALPQGDSHPHTHGNTMK